MTDQAVWTYPRRRATGVAAILAMVMVAGLPVQAGAQTSRAGNAQTTASYDIAAQPLGQALAAWSARSGIRVQSLPQVAEAIQGGAARGDLTPVAALDALLQGTGYSFRFTRVDAVVIEPIPAASGAGSILGTVRVQGTTEIATQGVNGSTDITATEGSDSYAADQTTIATKIPLSMKDTPQSVSVVTQQQLQDRNVTDFQRALMEAPGISTVIGNSGGANNGHSNLEPAFYSRGFLITRLQIDGGAPLNIQPDNNDALVPQINMAAYDHIEILRGADGLFNGQGNPGGTINLTRKRPLDHQQLLFSQLVGSWNNFNTMVDGSSPLTADGKLRARVVLSRQSNDYFYDTAKNKQIAFYATLEAEVLPGTIISGGVNFQSQDAVPFQNGLIGGLVNGQPTDLRLPRSTCFCFDWNRQSYDSHEFFGRFEQSLFGDWKLRLNGAYTRQTADYSYAGVIGVVGSPNPDDRPHLNDAYGRNRSTQYTADAYLGGTFMLFGNQQQLVLGGNYFSSDGGGQASGTPTYLYTSLAPIVDPYNFNQANYPKPDRGDALPFSYTDVSRSSNLGAYLTFRFTPWKPLHFTYGGRYNRYTTLLKTHFVCRNAFGCFDYNNNFAFVPTNQSYGAFTSESKTAKLFPLSSLAVSFDILKTLSAYASRTAIYIDQSLSADAQEKSLPPITGSNYEGGLKYASADHRLTASVAAFYVKQKGFPSFDFAGLFSNPNVNPQTGKLPDGRSCCFISDPNVIKKSKGIDVEVAGELFPGFQISGSYIYNKTKSLNQSTANGEMPGPLEGQAPVHIYKAWTKYTFQPGSRLKGFYLGAGIEGQSAGTSAGSVCTNYFYDPVFQFGYCSQFSRFTQRLAPRVIFSAQTGYQISENLAVALSVSNLLDKRYYVSVGVVDGGNWYGTPRSFALSLRGHF